MRKNDEKKSSGNKLLFSVLFGSAAGFILVLVIFAIFSSVIASGKVSESIMPYLTALAAVLGALVGAVIAAGLQKGRLMIVGLSVGALMFIVTFICALFSGGGQVTGSMTVVLLICFAAGGVAGSFLSLKRKSRKRT